MIRRRVLRILMLTALLVGGPAASMARQTMSFIPGDKSRILAPRPKQGPPPVQPIAQFRAGRGRAAKAAMMSKRTAGSAAVAVPGPGFTLEDGVLTYPAPARFQPKALEKR